MNWEEYATTFEFGVCAIQNRPLRIEARNGDSGRKWSVFVHNWCLSRDGFWSREPIPSERSDEFIANHRFDTKEDAFNAYDRFLRKGQYHRLFLDAPSEIEEEKQ